MLNKLVKGFKPAIFMFVIVMFGLLLVACDNETELAEPLEEDIELTFIFADGDVGAKDAMNEIVSRFNDAHDHITVTVIPGIGGSYAEFLMTQQSVGEFPDILELPDVAAYVRAGMVSPLPPEIVNLFSSLPEFDGNVYAAPLAAANTFGVIYNRAYFEANGLEVPTTHDEFFQLLEAIDALGDMSPLVVGGADLWHMGFLFQQAYFNNVVSQNPDFIRDAYLGEVDFADQMIADTFTEFSRFLDFAQDGWSSTSDAQITTFLVNEMSAMAYSGTHLFNSVIDADPDFDFGWFPITGPDGQLRLTGGPGGPGLAISAEAAEDDNRRMAAETFIQFFFAPENYRIYLEALGFLPSTIAQPELTVSPVLQQVIDANNAADLQNVMWNAEVTDRALPPGFRDLVYKVLVEYVQGTRSFQEAANEMNEVWEVSIRTFNPVEGIFE